MPDDSLEYFDIEKIPYLPRFKINHSISMEKYFKLPFQLRKHWYHLDLSYLDEEIEPYQTKTQALAKDMERYSQTPINVLLLAKEKKSDKIGFAK